MKVLNGKSEYFTQHLIELWMRVNGRCKFLRLDLKPLLCEPFKENLLLFTIIIR